MVKNHLSLYGPDFWTLRPILSSIFSKLSDCLPLSLRIPSTPFNSVFLRHGKLLDSSQLNCPSWTKALKPQTKKEKFLFTSTQSSELLSKMQVSSMRTTPDCSQFSEPPWIGRCFLIWCYLTDFVYALYKSSVCLRCLLDSQSQSKSFPQTGRKTCFRAARVNPSYLSQTSLWWQMLLLKDGKLI